MRLPDLLYQQVEKLYRAQRAVREREREERARRQTAATYAYWQDFYARHGTGTCGGAANGCPYVPCVPRIAP